MKNIWAVGRNYEEHAKELGNLSPAPNSEPMIFLKSVGAIVPNGREVQLPTWSKDVQHELEIAIRLGLNAGGKPFVDAFTIALDLTARDLQNQLKAKGCPWTLAKSFKNSCPLGDWVPASKLGKTEEEVLSAFNELEFSLKINDQERQRGLTSHMLHRLADVLQYIADRFPIQEGDVLLTGTPAGVTTLKPGDRAEAEIKGFTKANWAFV